MVNNNNRNIPNNNSIGNSRISTIVNEPVKKKSNKKINPVKVNAIKKLFKSYPFLETKYNFLSKDAEDKFGYYWNQVVCYYLYKQYIKTNKEIFYKYKELYNEVKNKKNRNTSNKINNQNINPMEESTTTSSVFGTDGFPIMRGAFNMDRKQDMWNPKNVFSKNKFGKSIGMKVIKPNTKTHTQGINSYKTKK